MKLKKIQKNIKEIFSEFTFDLRLDTKEIDLSFYQNGDIIGVIKDKNNPTNHNLNNLDFYEVIK